MPSAMKKEYAAVPKGSNINRSRFDLSQRHLTTQDGDVLAPIFWEWLFPGDVARAKYTAFVRMSSPLDYPLMDNMTLTIHSFFCPLRILWDNARKFFVDAALCCRLDRYTEEPAEYCCCAGGAVCC